jgi:aldehyde dehydrogenase (NAD+)
LLSKRQLERVEKMVQDAAARGLHVLCGGKRLLGENYAEGNFFEPTLIEVDGMQDPITREEIFGPVATLHRAHSLSDAIAQLNDSSFGLTASVYTENLHRAERCIQQLQVGVVHVNGNSYGSEPHMPFGGGRNSGNGTREAGTEALENYTQWKTVTITHNASIE